MIETTTKATFKWNKSLTAALSRNMPKGPIRQRSTCSFDSLSSAETRVDNVIEGAPSKSFSERDAAELDDTSSTITNTTTRQEKRVKFCVDADDDIVAQVIFYPKFSEKDAENLYWSSDERQEFVFNLRSDADDMHIDHSCHIEQLDEIYEQSLQREVNSTETKDGIRSIMEWSCKTGGRGLEGLVMNSLRKSRRRCIRNVLKLQKSLPEDISYTDAAKQLRKRSRRCSRNAEEFAFLLALGDSAAVEASQR